MSNSDYDVVIVGGRPAGASLAARLGMKGHRVLLLDRASFPSPPKVPSSPFLYSSAMAVLDEIGLPESDYAAAIVRLKQIGFNFSGHFETVMDIPSMWGRDYIAGLDRAVFDEILWRSLERFASVERREGFVVNDVVRDERGRVVGVIGREREGRGGEGREGEGSEGVGREQTIRARAVVGADGRFSLVARKVGARVVEAETECLSTVYYAAWEGVGAFMPGMDGPHAQLHTTGRGLDALFVPVLDGRVLINTHERADRVDIQGDAQRYYVDALATIPAVARVIRGASQVSEVIGIKRIGNGYRESSGPGWALVGDAVHYKDPVDGQGIYDALLGARLLAASLTRWLTGELGWEAAMAAYARELHAATHPMFEETIGRLRRELYAEPPGLVIDTLIRWTMTDPAYHERYLQYLGRTIHPTGWASPGLVAKAVLRGIGRDLGRLRARSG
ncbi:FAD-dependent monooxygenase [Pseudenhygromyxa sp. WMMC2535]|uniref:NAD(P)/FAD-dependent oxidoreductase n=1 Tax=Pseudenhygromyxa sp. WMMC2535 TaxID=2712867 RepID=UPI0015555BE9|nr:FAD-dependent monooxygenase [Pseudenhygromyxa sp. WMMC2535]NVB41209.1 FAD-dependent monooxygenase [Pseudenhygromyxa sp. WMMC2535]